MKTKAIILLLMICNFLYGQKGITFEIESLSKPDHILKTSTVGEIYLGLFMADAGLTPYEIEEKGIEYSFNILSKSKGPDYLVNLGYHSFFNGMYKAYADHRPFVLSPDMIWLLISQGFARHINANPEKMRDYFVDFKGKKSLVVRSNYPLNKLDTKKWYEIIPKFTEQIKKEVGEDLVNILSLDFSTTSEVEKIASEITIMEAVEPYFEYIVFYAICGIPELTL